MYAAIGADIYMRFLFDFSEKSHLSSLEAEPPECGDRKAQGSTQNELENLFSFFYWNTEIFSNRQGVPELLVSRI